MSPPRRLAVALIAATLLLAGTGCQSSTPHPQGSTMDTQSAEMPDLPDDPAAAKAVVRKMLMGEAIVLLKASGLKYSAAQFDVPFAPYTDLNAQKGDLLIQFRACSHGQEQAMTDAIWANGWEQGSISHAAAHGRKGPLDLQWGNGADGWVFEMTTVNIRQELHVTDDRTIVPELAAFKALP